MPQPGLLGLAATATRPAATATRPAASASASASAAGSGAIVTDEDKRCQMALPAGITEDAPGSGEFTLANDAGFALLQSIEGADLATTVTFFIPSFTAIFTDYQEVNRTKAADSERVDFTGELIQPLRGTMYFKQFGSVTCNLILVTYTSSNFPYDQALNAMISSLQAVKP